eukprot:GHVU01032701.1.p1 GENE.GHVU01032701.1~~GHVU01032701.1.p1  ORF type:complete len:224 (+),score=22.98 GHVU01032701.1:1211-1882(+)
MTSTCDEEDLTSHPANPSGVDLSGFPPERMCGPPAGRRITAPAEIAELAEAARRERRQRLEYRTLCFQVLLLWGLSGCFCAHLRALVPSSFLVRVYYWDTPVTSEEGSEAGESDSQEGIDQDPAARRQRLEESGLATWLPDRRQLTIESSDHQDSPPLPPAAFDSVCSPSLWRLEAIQPLDLGEVVLRRSPDASEILGSWLLSIREAGWLPSNSDTDPDSDSD